MRVCSLRTRRLKLILFLLTVAMLLCRSAAAEPDRLARTFLGLGSLTASFAPPQDKKCCCLAVAKFDDGKFLGYATVLLPVENIHVSPDRPNYEAELGWAEKNGKFGYCLTTPAGAQGFQADEFFRGLGAIQPLAVKRPPTQTLGPFSVLGFAFGGPGTTVEGAKPDVGNVIRAKFRVAVFLMAAFETQDQANDFCKSLPKLSAD